MRNKIWSLISFMNAPSWFVTFSLADVKHPISLYFADTKEKFFSLDLRDENERYRLIAQNPVDFFTLCVKCLLNMYLK